MLKKEAVVVEKRGNKVILSLRRDKICGHCNNLFCGIKDKNKIVLESPFPLKIGDKVELGIESKVYIFLSLVIFLLPALIFIGSIYLLRNLDVVLSFSLGISGLILYFLLVKLFLIKRIKDKLSCKIVSNRT